ncbi:MAG TPA: hypothetical protein VGQ56_19700 [Gemmatimonadaceae bacterium]|nr:hypothetical protein [Gemmatimonadaceae bacterium]
MQDGSHEREVELNLTVSNATADAVVVVTFVAPRTTAWSGRREFAAPSLVDEPVPLILSQIAHGSVGSPAAFKQLPRSLIVLLLPLALGGGHNPQVFVKQRAESQDGGAVRAAGLSQLGR